MDTAQNPYGYWNAITEQASEQAFLRCGTPLERLIAQQEGSEPQDTDPLISFETNPDNHCTGIASFATEHTRSFLELLPVLDPEYREMLLEYYLLEKKEAWLGRIHGRTQTVCSSEIRASVKVLSGQTLLGPNPQLPTLRRILAGAGLETVELPAKQGRQKRKVSVSQLVYAFAQSRSFANVADLFEIHRPAIRRTFRQISAQLKESSHPNRMALGYYIHQLYYRGAPSEAGPSKHQRAKQKRLSRIALKDSPTLGQFEVNVSDSGFTELFTTTSEPQ